MYQNKSTVKPPVCAKLLPCGILATVMCLYVWSLSVQAQGTWDTQPDTWVATDALGRTLPNAEVVGAPRSNRTVAMFYYLWNGSHSTGLYDISKIITQDPNAIHDFNNVLWGPQNHWHHWGEPLLGYYFMQDQWIIRRHAQMLTDAGVDVIFFDCTNGPNNQYRPVYDALLDTYQDLLAHGHDVPKIAFLTHSNSGTSIQKLYDDVYKDGRHSNLWYYWNGKPLILGEVSEISAALQAFFTVRHSWAFDPGDKSWPWIERYPQQGGWSGTTSNIEQVSVSSGAHPTEPNGGDGKSNHLNVQPANADLDTDLGIRFQDQWRRARELAPPLVLVTQWNEWTAQRFQYTGNGQSYAGRPLYKNDPWFIDVFDKEFNRDIEPMKGGHGDNYYYQLIDNIRRYKGVRQAPAASAPASIVLNDLSGWDSVTPEFRDDQDDVRHRDYRGFGSQYYTNTTGNNDVRLCKVARDESILYLLAETVDTLSPMTTGSTWWMNCYIRNEAMEAPSWEGYHYKLGNDASQSGNLVLWRSTGGANWEFLANVSTHASGNRVVVSIPRSLLGLPANSTFTHISFKWTDNQEGFSADNWLLNGDAAPNGRFRYRYWAGGSADQPVHGNTYRVIQRETLQPATPSSDATISGAGLTTADNGFGLNQKWAAFRLDSGAWVLFNAEATAKNGSAGMMAMDVPNASGLVGASVKSTTYTGNSSQHWNLIALGDGWYRMVNLATGQALSRDPSGALVQTTVASDFRQYWGFEDVAPINSAGTYRFSSRPSNLRAAVKNRSMNPGTAIMQETETGAWNQDWLVYQQDAARLQIVSEESRRPLQGPNASIGSVIIQGNWSADALQTWRMKMVSPGFYQLVNAGSGLALGVLGQSVTSGASLAQKQPDLSSMDQQWHLASSAQAPGVNGTLIFSDNFNTADGNNLAAVNANVATRQFGTLANNLYANYTGATESISSGRMVVGRDTGLFNYANFKPALTTSPTNFTLSFDAQYSGTSGQWASPFLTTHGNDDNRGTSEFGLLLYQNGTVSAYGGTGAAQTVTSLSPATLTTLLGSWNVASMNSYSLAATATTANSGTYDVFINGTEVLSNIAYHLGTGVTVAGRTGLFFSVRNISGGAGNYDNLLLSNGPGPVDHFAISSITSPQTVGTAIPGITITAQDSANATATSFTGTVTFGGTGGFSGTSGTFTAGVLNGVSVTPTIAGSNLTFTVDDGASHTGSTTITTIQTQYQAWAGGAAFDGDANGEGVDNGLAFLLGASGPTSAVTLPTVTENGGDLVLNFNCLPDAARGNATLRVEHSRDLGVLELWTATTNEVPDVTNAVPDNNVTFEVGAGPVGPPALNSVEATIDSAAAAGNKLFGRLKAEQP